MSSTLTVSLAYNLMSERPRVYRTKGFVLKRMDLGEADKILTIYTSTSGKLRAVAKGVRRPSSRLGGHVDDFAYADMLLARGRDLDVVTQSQTHGNSAPRSPLSHSPRLLVSDGDRRRGNDRPADHVGQDRGNSKGGQ